MDGYMSQIQEIVSECLEQKKIGVMDSLLQNGADSMNMLYILNQIEARFDIKIPDDELMISNFETIYQINTLVCRLKEEKRETDAEERKRLLL